MSEKTFSVTSEEFVGLVESEEGRQYLERLLDNRKDNLQSLAKLVEKLRHSSKPTGEVLHGAISMCVYDLLAARAYARHQRKYDLGDDIRRGIIEQGVEVNDRANATHWQVWGFRHTSSQASDRWKVAFEEAKPIKWERPGSPF